MSRSGTNYLNYLFFLHPSIKGLGHVPHAELTSNIQVNLVKDWYGIWRFWLQRQGTNPLPYYGHALRDENNTFEAYHHQQNAARSGFRGVCFKADGGEGWFNKVFPRILDRGLIIYSIRYPIVSLYEAWKRWGGHQGVRPEVFLKNVESSIRCAEALKRGAGERYEFLPISISDSHEEIVGRLQYGMKLVGLRMTRMQKKFLEKRRPLAINISSRQREKTDEELYQELVSQGGNKIKELDERYKLLLEDERWMTT